MLVGISGLVGCQTLRLARATILASAVSGRGLLCSLVPSAAIRRSLASATDAKPPVAVAKLALWC